MKAYKASNLVELFSFRRKCGVYFTFSEKKEYFCKAWIGMTENERD